MEDDEEAVARVVTAMAERCSLSRVELGALVAWWKAEKAPEETFAEFLERKGLVVADARASAGAGAPPQSADVDFRRLWSQQGVSLSKERNAPPTPGVMRRPPGQRPVLANAPTAAIATKETASMTPLVLSGKTFGQYLLRQPLPAAPSGVLFEAEDLLLGRQIVVKIVMPERLPGGLRDAPRFLQRVLASSRVAHPNCLTVLAAGQHDGWFYVAMPMMLGGSTLDRVLAHGPMTPLEATRCCKMATRGLAAAHAAGIIHGNVKPSNILLEKDEVRLADFGLGADWALSNLSTTSLRRAFDQARRHDLAAMGYALHFLLTGRPAPPTTAADREQSWQPGLSIPDGLHAVIHRAISESAAQPFAAANEFAAALEQIEHQLLDGGPPRRPPGDPSPAPRTVKSRAELLATAMAATPNLLGVGMRLGKCLLTEHIARGGFATIYRAHHQTLGIPVALKVLRVDLLDKEPTAFEKFKAEARMLARLHHPNVVRVLDFDDNPHLPYLVLEFIEGMSLADVIEQSGRVHVARATQAIKQAAAGLAAAYRLGVIHRDVKPANILLSRDGVAKITDFGLAVLANDVDTQGNVRARQSDVWGTVYYMSPEQAEQSGIDFRSDMYALGVSYYQAVTGQLPFVGDTCMEVMVRHASEPPVSPLALVPQMNPALAAVMLRMLAKNPNDRYGSYEELIAALDQAEKPANAPSKPQPFWRGLLGGRGSG